MLTGLIGGDIITMCNSDHLFHVQNLNLEGLFLSKTKKIISILLVIAMVMSIAPVSVLTSAAESEFTYVEPTFSQSTYSIDTSATTEVIRVAAGIGSFSIPASGTAGKIVAATPSGVPENSGAFAVVGYGGETPKAPAARFTFYGDPSLLDGVPTPTPDNATIKFKDMYYTDFDGGRTYVYEINSGEAVAGSYVTYTWTYSVRSESYTAYSYSHVENILVMNGWLHHKSQTASWINSSIYQRHALVVQFQSKNMYSQMETGDGDSNKVVSNRKVGYINYGTGARDGGALKGAGNQDDLSSDVDAYASAAPNGNITGEEVPALIKSRHQGYDERRNMCYHSDTNRGSPKIYIDKRNENLETLNFRMTVQNAESDSYSSATISGPWIYNYEFEFGEEDSSFSTNADANIIAVKSNAAGTSGSSTIYAQSSADLTFKEYIMTTFKGAGPALGADITSANAYTIVADFTAKNNSHNESKYYGLTAGAINLEMYVYNTYDLYEMYSGVIRGTGNFTSQDPGGAGGYGNAVQVVFDRGANPQSRNYTSDSTVWQAYLDALHTAGKLLVTPDLDQHTALVAGATSSQHAIALATANLYTAYYNLQGYNSTVGYEIKHVDQTTGKVIVASNGTSDVELIQTHDMYGGKKAAGTTMVAKAASIKGYKVVGESSKTVTFSGKNAVESVKFEYVPEEYFVNVYSNNPNVPTTTLTYNYGDTVDADDFVYGVRDYYTFKGWYTDGNFSKPLQTAADGTFTMSNEDVDVFGKWEITPVNITLNLVSDGTTLETKSIGTVQLLDETTPVTFTPTKDQASKDGYLFAGFYSDAALTTPVTSVSYSFDDYKNGTMAAKSTIYAKMVDVNGKLAFVANGGTEVADIPFEAGDTIESPVTTRKGYTFAGWWDEKFENEYTFPWTAENNTGFIAYAKWEPNDVTISFKLGTPASEFDTEAILPLRGKADEEIKPGQIPPAPCKFGKTFAQWVIQGSTTVFNFDYFPLEDITLVPVWNDTAYSAFVSIDAYEKLSGNYVQIAEAEEGEIVKTGAAQTEDVVTFRMTSLTNFYVGSTVFVFMYDKNFFELVDDGASAFLLNPENEYVAGIEAEVNGVTNNELLKGKWPAASDTIDPDTYNAMMVTIDPTVTIDNYNCEPMSDGQWLVEFQLRVKKDATGTGTVYMDNAWTRTADNIMGTMFYGWAKNGSVSVGDTYNNIVEPNLDHTVVTLSIDETPAVDTTVTIKAKPDDAPATNLAAFADGNVEKTFTGRAETEILDYEPPVREGYHITGYVNEADATAEKWVPGYYPATDGLTYVAEWEPDLQDVIFYDGADIHLKTQVGYEQDITAPTAPIKQGYVLKGWSLTEGGTETVTFPYKTPLGGATFYAVWGPAENTKYTIIAHYGANSTTTKVYENGITDSTLKIVAAVPDPAEANTMYVTYDQLPKQSNYEFDPDNVNNTAENLTAVIKPDGTTVINVYYKASDVTVTFNAGSGAWADGSTTKVISGPFQSVIPADKYPEAPIREGYTFDGWNGVTVGTTTYIPSTKSAKWKINSYTATFDANGGCFNDDPAALTMTKSFNYNAAVSAPATPAQTGYTFLGWSTDKDAKEATPLGNMPAGDTTYYAVYALTDYTITYYVDGAEHLVVANKHMGDSITLEAAPIKTGYTFSGWKDAEGNEMSNFTMGAGNVEIYGTFSINSYDTIFYANGGYFNGDTTDTEETVTTVFGQPINAPAVARAGHSFLGWTDTEGSSSVVNVGSMDTEGGKKFYAVWKAEIWDYTVETYVMDTTGNYGEKESSQTFQFTVGETVTYTAPAREGFTPEQATVSGVVSVENPLVLKVYYERNQYTLTWIDPYGEGSTIETGTKYYEEAISAPAYTREGYTLTGWTPAVDATMPAEDTTYTAVIAPVQYTVKFYMDENMTGTPETVTAGYETVYNVPKPTKTGYTFDKWMTKDGADAGLTAGGTATMPLNGAEYYATWTVNQYTANFIAGTTAEGTSGQFKDGSNRISKSFDYGAQVVVPEIPTATGYYFNGWSPAIDAAMPAATRNYMAQWAVESYTVNWVSNGETVLSEPVEYGATLAAPAVSREGYTFGGWEGKPEDDIMTDAGDNGAAVTYTAIWTVNKYDVVYMVDGIEHQRVEDVAFGTEVTLIDEPTKTGYTFSGWDSENFTMPDNEVVISGTFTVNKYDVVYMVDGVEHQRVENVAYGTNVTLIDEPTKVGYTFSGWDSENFTMPDNEVVISGTFNVNKYNVVYKVDGAVYQTVENVAFGTNVTLIDEPTKEGYTFSGWDREDFVMPNNEVTVSGTFTVNQYDAIFYVDGKEFATVPTNFGEIPVAPDASNAKEGYTFTGWSPALSAMTTAGATYTAQFEGNEGVEYTVETYKMDIGGKTYTMTDETLTGKAGETATAATPAIDGFTYDASQSEISGKIAGDGSLVLKVYYTRNTYTFKTVVDGKETSSTTYYFEEAVTAPETPVKEGYTFGGWDISAPGTMPSDNVTMSGVFVVNQYAVTFLNYDGGVHKSENVDFGKAISKPADDPVKVNFIFKGWSLTEVDKLLTEDELSTVTMIDFETAAPTVPVNGITIYPVFVRVNVTLTLVAGSTAEVDKTDATDTVTGYIFGLETRLTKTKLLSTYLAVEGDGRLEVTLTQFNVCGTGTKVEVIDNVTELPVETYYLIIYGDVNGDSEIDSTDAAVIGDEIIGVTAWSNTNVPAEYDHCKVLAADLERDETIDTSDLISAQDIAIWLAYVDQINRSVVYYNA